MHKFCKEKMYIVSFFGHFFVANLFTILFILYLINNLVLWPKCVNSWKLTLIWIQVIVSKPGFQKRDMSWNADFYTHCQSSQAHCLNDYFFQKQTKSLFWPTFSSQILIIFSFFGKNTDCTSFAKKFLQIISIFEMAW